MLDATYQSQVGTQCELSPGTWDRGSRVVAWKNVRLERSGSGDLNVLKMH